MSLIEIQDAGGSSSVWISGSGKPLVLIHGFPLNHQMWVAQLESLSHHFQVIAPDLPGFGRTEIDSVSADGELRFSMKSMADWIANLLDLLGVSSKVVYCGLSMGGYIGWEFARRHTERLDRLIACNTRAAADTEVVRRGRKLAAREVMQNGVEPVADAMLPKLFSDSVRGEAIRLDHMKQARRDTRHAIETTPSESIAAGQLAMAARQDARQWLSQIDIPALLVAGEYDQITPASEMESDASRMPQAEFVCIPQAAHMAPLEMPEVFNREVVQWLQ